MTRYDLVTLLIALDGAGKVLPAIDAWSKSAAARGTLLGCWLSEAGDQQEVILLRGFADDASMQEERWRTLATANPFGCGELINSMRFDSYAPFPWLPPVAPGRYGQIYELRTYWLKPGGVPGTMAAWQAALPGRVAVSPLVVAMYALDGAPRFTHIWPYRTIGDRARIRQEVVAQGVWPPQGGPDWLTGEIVSIVAVPAGISRLS